MLIVYTQTHSTVVAEMFPFRDWSNKLFIGYLMGKSTFSFHTYSTMPICNSL